jgi:hypothetical protein
MPVDWWHAWVHGRLLWLLCTGAASIPGVYHVTLVTYVMVGLGPQRGCLRLRWVLETDPEAEQTHGKALPAFCRDLMAPF